MSRMTMIRTKQVNTQAKRLARYARYSTGRRGSPGVQAETIGMRERLIQTLGRGVVDAVARITPARQHKIVAAELVRAVSRMSPTVLLALGTVLMFGLTAL